MRLAVGVYLRETKRKNRDGSVVRYLQLARSERHPDTGVPSAKVIHNFGRADQVDKDVLARLVASISRFLEPEQADPRLGRRCVASRNQQLLSHRTPDASAARLAAR